MIRFRCETQLGARRGSGEVEREWYTNRVGVGGDSVGEGRLKWRLSALLGFRPDFHDSVERGLRDLRPEPPMETLRVTRDNDRKRASDEVPGRSLGEPNSAEIVVSEGKLISLTLIDG